uniref:Transmembrane protein 202 n=1 Tax=Nannospalax galili TaxID=1026970 RepID=A0A8C6QTT1_NANGA
MERKEQTMTFYSPEVPKIKGDRKYQRPTLPTNKSESPQRLQQYVDQTYTYTRMFCGSLCGFSLLLLICTSPLSWVQFLVTNNGLELYAGLWTLCNHELCWSHTPKPPYYLQYSRAAFIVSVLTILTGLGFLFSSCRLTEGSVTPDLDLKLSMLNFMSAICLLLCLNLFLAQVDWHTMSAMESQFLWTYYLNWFSDILNTCAGIISFLIYLTAKSNPHNQSVRVIPQEKSRLGIDPVPKVLPAKAGSGKSEMKSPSVSGKRPPSTRL